MSAECLAARVREHDAEEHYGARARETLQTWHDDPCAGEEALIRLVSSLCAAVAAEATMTERHRIHTRLRTRAAVDEANQ